MAQPRHPDLDCEEPQPRLRRHPKFREKAEEMEESPPPLRDGDLPGMTFMVLDRDWGFETGSSSDHPGICVYLADQTAIFVQGTDAFNWRVQPSWLHVAPTPDNGLRLRTAFRLAPRPIRLRRARLFYPDRQLGRVDECTLATLRDKLARLHPED